MRAGSFAVTLFLQTAVCFAQPSVPPARDNPAPTGTAAIRGRVMVAGGDRALPKVDVRASSPTTGVVKAVLTDANGRYTIADLPAGRYTVTATKPNFVRAAYGERRPLGAGQPIDVADGKTIDRIDFALQRTAAITGRIVDEFGDPVVDAQVLTMRFGYFNGERRLQPAGGGFTATNDLGEYRIFGLTPGQYFVTATLRGFNDFGADASTRTAYTPTYYPGTGNLSEAQRITVQPGQTISGINMTLLPVMASRINGVVLDSQGRPMGGAFVNAMKEIGGFIDMGGGTQSKADGTFSINGLAPGTYTLRAGTGPGPDELAVAQVTVTGDVSDVQLVAAKAATLSGRVRFEPGPIPPPAPTALRLSAMPVTGSPLGMMGPGGVPKNDWTFEIKSMGGRVRIMANVMNPAPPNQRPNAIDWRLNRIVVGDADVTDTGLDLPAGAAVDNVLVEMTTRASEVDATVVDASGAPVQDCVVVVFPQDSQRWISQSRFFASGRPDQEGVFRGRVGAGDYLVVAFDDPEQNLSIFADPDVLSQLRDRATAVSVADGEKKSIALKLSEPPVY